MNKIELIQALKDDRWLSLAMPIETALLNQDRYAGIVQSIIHGGCDFQAELHIAEKSTSLKLTLPYPLPKLLDVTIPKSCGLDQNGAL